MIEVLIAIADPGAAIQLEEALTRAGLSSRWDAASATGPKGDLTAIDVVVLEVEEHGPALAALVDTWRDHPTAPGLIAIGAAGRDREHAAAAKVALLPLEVTPAALRAAVEEAARMRFTAAMSWHLARRVLGLPPGNGDLAEAVRILAAARSGDTEMARAALRWHAHDYATDLGAIALLRDARALTIPEVELTAHLGGTLTVQTLAQKGPVDPGHAVRLLWALVSIGGVALSPEPRDLATPARRVLSELRRHLRARARRLPGSTYYDVLEVPATAEDADIERAYRAVGQRYAPALLARFDLGDTAALVGPMWELVEKARQVLLDPPARGRYHDWLRGKLPTLKTAWAIDAGPAKLAADAFARGQRALGEGDAHRALSELATACRHHAGHPEYEANLAWARYRVQVTSGKDREGMARAERAAVEELLTGTRAWPRGLLALALLCAADGDPDSARWHLREALAVDPNLPAAQQLLARLGGRARTAPA
ncbi:MAG: tetratricopeptide repeat protein [Kofleriaceae bacterium]|nr:tetratricopeptide repeat protein [Kofleriaceae bacterium]